MQEILVIREHTTDDILMVLNKNSVPIDLTGIDHVRVDMMDKNGKTFEFTSAGLTPQVNIVGDPTNGTISFTPPSENFFMYQNTPYQVYVWVYETVTKKYSCPETGFALINLEKSY
jgi:hypothetical protein